MNTQLIAVPGSDQKGNLYSVYQKIPTATGFNLGDFVGEIRVKELPLNCEVLGD